MKSQLIAYQTRTNQGLETFLNQQTATPPKLLAAIRYATLNQGKRLRPALLYATGEALGIPAEKLDDAANAIEFIHSYSLVHDDLPAMDDDDLRRGQPTCHIQFDEATAILVGDAQLTFSFEILAQSPYYSDQTKIQMIQLLTNAAGAKGMIGGQMIDMDSAGHLPEKAQLEKMHVKKTGALIQAAILLGAIHAPNYTSLAPQLNELGKVIGLAFQVQDDILDIESATEVLGKPQGSDESANKSTYPKLLGLEGAKKLRNQLIEEAQTLLEATQLNTPFLTQLVNYIATRNY